MAKRWTRLGTIGLAFAWTAITGPAAEARVQTWPAADPAARGPFTTVVDANVGPNNDFTIFRPAELGAEGRKHPVIIWGNGTGARPTTYRGMLDHLASHGFVVIASNQGSVMRGTPPYMIQSIDLAFAENENPESVLHGKLDVQRIGTTGHSQGGMATTRTAADARVRTIVPIQGGGSVPEFAGSALVICGGQDRVVPCSRSQATFEAMGRGPIMYASLRETGHTDWIRAGAAHAHTKVLTAWFRAELMDDAAARAMFYGPDCSLCGDAAWEIMRKNMD